MPEQRSSASVDQAEPDAAGLRPVAEGLFTPIRRLGDPVQLIAARCDTCAAVHFPRRVLCSNCSSSALRELLVGPRGTLYSYTSLPDVPEEPEGGPYIVGQVVFPEGVRVQGRLRRFALADLALDRPVLAVLGAIGAGDGETTVSYVFQPEQT
ncbi:MAG: Zn-ribbon domain-containing OB-fold protein [Dehalococcoidia bacterium]